MGVCIMAENIRFGKGTLTTSSANLDTSATPIGKKRLVKSITLCNKTTTERHCTIALGGTNIVFMYYIPGYGSEKENTRVINNVDQWLTETERITGAAAANSAIDFIISGIEDDA
jgi:hypothetical protein